MKKRMIAWLLVISILIPMVFVSSVYAAEPDTYMVPSYRLYQNFMEDSFPDAFNHRLYFATLDACSDLNNLIDKASWVIGEDLTVERCTEILANMVTLMNYQLEDAIVEQAKVDTTKTLLDYGVDIAGIAAGAIGTDTLKKGCDSVMKKITTAIGITNGALDFTASTIEDLELLVQLEGDYSMQYNFLETVYMYADIPEMKEAAQSLILANKEIMRYKLETITSVGESFAKFEATDVFLDQVAEKLLEDPDFWDSDAYGPLMVLSAVYSKFSLFKLTLDIGLFLGDSLFGTSDIYNRYNEMTALCDIHNALLARVKANPALNEEDYENMDRNISLMKMVLYVDARGEYCAYQMTTEGKLSELFSSANNENIEKNYNTSIDIIENTFASLDGLYVEEEWDSNTSDISVSSYLPVIEAAISETAYDSATGSGFLYDLDSDGVDELVILNVYAEVGGNSFPGHAYSVYDIENGEVIAKCDKELLFYDAGGPSGYVGVVNYLGNTALVVYIDNGETGYQAHRETLYTIYDPSSLQVIASASLDYVSADTVQVNNCTVNGKTCSYNDYLSVVDAIEPIIIADIYSNDESDGSMGLYELLRSIQEVCGITPDQSPQITKADAEQIANSVFGMNI